MIVSKNSLLRGHARLCYNVEPVKTGDGKE